MGSNDGASDEKPVHGVTLTKGYHLGATEVTQAQWESVMGSNPSKFKGRDLPVENVSWDDAMAYCRKLTERERAAGRLAAGYAYTLPTEAQWEYAYRAGTTGAYAGDLGSMAWYGENSGNKTHAVATKRANAWGLYDMHGNVWEWCSDWYGSYASGRVVDPTGARSGTGRIARGGSWFNDASYCRSALRSRDSPDYRINGLGFRLAHRSVQD
jgi:formylglycine-generating enzyme required for sulfatase activity